MANQDSTKLQKLYWRWGAMIQRCENPKNKFFYNYGARGINVCPKWRQSFENFLIDMGMPPDNMTLERKDNNKGYLKKNCYWASRQNQALNRRIFQKNKSGIKGIEHRNYGSYRIRIRRNKKIVLDITTNDFFEACCIKKSYELKETSYGH